jgi:tetratricopeptide (TPR) repeat protein
MVLSVLLTSAGLALLAQEPPPAAPPAPTAAATPGLSRAGDASAANAAIEAGLAAFKRRRFRQAEDAFQRALDADPQSAAAAYYLGYALYKRAEPTRRLTPEKRRAAEMFARAFELDPVFKPDWGARK